MAIGFERVEMPGDRRRVIEFLRHDEWPFHGPSELASGDAIEKRFSSDAIESFWITDDSETAGLIQLLDLDDIGEGAPLFDLRIVEVRRGQGLGKRATRWLTDYLVATYPELHRIEANTRADNFAMQRVLFCSGFLHEGTLRQAWRGGDGSWFDTMVYGCLRQDWHESRNTASSELRST